MLNFLATLESVPDDDDSGVVVLLPLIVPAEHYVSAKLIALEVAARIEKKYGIEMNVEDIDDEPLGLKQ